MIKSKSTFLKNKIREEIRSILKEKAKSKSQQRLTGMALAYKRGELKNASEKVKELAISMSEKDLKDFASTKHDEIEEISTTGSIDGFNTPFAFSNDDEEDLDKEYEWEIIGESINWMEEGLTPKQKINESIKSIRMKLNEIEKIIKHTIKFKNENDLPFENYWKRTKRNLNTIGEQLIRISNKIKNQI